MRVFLDTNLLLDVLLNRAAFIAESESDCQEFALPWAFWNSAGVPGFPSPTPDL